MENEHVVDRCAEKQARRDPWAPWTFEEGVLFVRKLQNELAPAYGVAMAGSVLMRGWSKTDLDIVIFPYDVTEQSYTQLKVQLENFGLVQKYSRPDMQGYRRRRAQLDRKHVEVWRHGSQRVDIFFLQ